MDKIKRILEVSGNGWTIEKISGLDDNKDKLFYLKIDYVVVNKIIASGNCLRKIGLDAKDEQYEINKGLWGLGWYIGDKTIVSVIKNHETDFIIKSFAFPVANHPYLYPPFNILLSVFFNFDDAQEPEHWNKIINGLDTVNLDKVYQHLDDATFSNRDFEIVKNLFKEQYKLNELN